MSFYCYFFYLSILSSIGASLVAQRVKHLTAMWETWVRFLGWEDLLEKGAATHSSVLAWRIPWTEEPGRPQSPVWQRVRHNLATEQRHSNTHRCTYFSAIPSFSSVTSSVDYELFTKEDVLVFNMPSDECTAYVQKCLLDGATEE